jgi:arabinofuranosyltransferase
MRDDNAAVPTRDAHASTTFRIVLFSGCAFLAIALLRTAWVADDGFITMRTADNVLNGYGLVWNAGERVQTFTHPLWLAFCTMAFALVGNAYFSLLVLCLVTTIAAVWLLVRLSATPWNLALCFTALLSSKAFLDFSTSGLENPLSNLLLIAFVWQWWDASGGEQRLRRLALLAALATLNRQDLFLLVAPAVAAESLRVPGKAAVRALVAGWLPLVAWEAFSLFYYGTAVPNTAHAKLTTALPLGFVLERGYDYVMRTALYDPATLPVVILATFSVATARRRADWPLLWGSVLYIAYAIGVGGDFMMGRFFVAPFIVSVAILARAEWARVRRPALAAAAGVILLGLAAPWEPALLSGYGYSSMNNRIRGLHTPEPADGYRYMTVRSVVDERRRYSEFTGLFIIRRDGVPEHGWAYDGYNLRINGPRVVSRKFIGMTGFFAGPGVHIIDELALGDPLLARIPGGHERSTMGHLDRPIPIGYVETVASGRNQIADKDLSLYYEALHEVISGPLWDAHRIITLGRFVSGRYDHYLSSYLARAPVPTFGSGE